MLSILSSVWRWRRLVRELARRDFKARYAGSALGVTWSVLEPLIQFGLYLVVFSVFLGMRFEDNPRVGSFGLYLVSGLVPYLAFQESVHRATGLARAEAGLVRHVNAPLEVLLAGSLIAIFVRFGIAFLLVVVAAVGFGTVHWVQLPWVVVGLLLLVAGSWGVALALVPAGAFMPDLPQVVGTATTVMFFLTPIVYPAKLLQKAIPWLLVANPLVGLLGTFRVGLVGGTVVAASLAVTVAAVVFANLLGGAIFVRRARAVRDVV
jgi:ABC-type polysaccharide/polyol phosphate export permease